MRPTFRLSLAAAVLALVLPVPANAMTDAASGFGWAFAPKRAFPGKKTSVGVAVKTGTPCLLNVRYADGGVQEGLKQLTAKHGRAVWTWRVPKSAESGPADVSAFCAGYGRLSKTIVVVGNVIAARIDVVKSGFSVRPELIGSTVSYGVILANRSPQQDALDVSVLVNLVMPDNKLIGSVTSRLSGIAAGAQYALGGDMNFTWVPPIAKLEVVVQVGRHGPPTHDHPGLANIRVVGNPYDPGFVGSVEGELINDNPTKTMYRADVSAVVFDGAGNVIGGGTGFAFASLPPGSREFIKIQGGFRAIPVEKAASAQVTVLPTWQ
jgi:hypothetical protein